MKTVFLHGLGQTAQDWEGVIRRTSLADVECPELFSLSKNGITYPHIFAGLEKRYADSKEPLCLCGLSLGALLALDYTIRHRNQVAYLILIGAQYQSPTLLVDLQNLAFRCMPEKAFESIGISKKDTITLAHSMRLLDFRQGLKDVLCPVTILCGEKDQANRKAAEQLAMFLPQSELHIIPGVGHEVNKCAPEAIAAILNKDIIDMSQKNRGYYGTDCSGI